MTKCEMAILISWYIKKNTRSAHNRLCKMKRMKRERDGERKIKRKSPSDLSKCPTLCDKMNLQLLLLVCYGVEKQRRRETKNLNNKQTTNAQKMQTIFELQFNNSKIIIIKILQTNTCHIYKWCNNNSYEQK